MMRSLTSDGVLLSLIAIILPLHLLLTLRFRQLHSDRRLGTLRSVLVFASIPVLILAIFVRSDPKTSPPTADGIISQMEEVKHKISQLESILEENTKALSSKTITVKENNERIEGMEHKIQYLQNTLCNFKASPSETAYSEERIVAMDEEVRLLWEESRKNNFNIHVLESKASVLEGKLMDVAAEVEKMESIITEQWIQIRQLEQSLHMTKTMMQKRSASKVQDKRQPKKWILQKFIESIRHCNLPDLVALPDSLFLGSSRTNSWISQAIFHLRTVLSVAKKWHHKLQYLVKQTMEMNEFTTSLANKEVVFFLAYAIMIFPLMGAWALCWACFDDDDKAE